MKMKKNFQKIPKKMNSKKSIQLVKEKNKLIKNNKNNSYCSILKENMEKDDSIDDHIFHLPEFLFPVGYQNHSLQ